MKKQQIRKLSDHPFYKDRRLTNSEYAEFDKITNDKTIHFRFKELVLMPSGEVRHFWSRHKKAKNGMKFVSFSTLNKMIKSGKKASLKWIRKNPEKRNEYMRKQRMDPDFRAKQTILSYIWQTLNNYYNRKLKYKSKMLQKMGMNETYFNKLRELKKDAEMMFGKVQLDHIIPLSVYKFANEDGERNYKAIKQAYKLSNLQFIPKKANIKKSNKLTRKGLELLKEMGVNPNV